MGLRFEIESPLLAPHFHHNVVGFGCPRRHFIAGQIRNASKQISHFVIEFACRLVQLVQPVLQRTRLVHHRRSILPGLLQRAHLLAQLIAPRLQLLRLRDRLAPTLVQGAKVAQQGPGIGPPRAQFLFYFLQVAPDKTQIEHVLTSLNDWIDTYFIAATPSVASFVGPALSMSFQPGRVWSPVISRAPRVNVK